MKTGVSVLTLVVLALAARGEPVWNVRSELLVVRVPQAAGLRLRPMLREAKTAAAGVTEVHAMIARDEAELIAAPVLWMPSGQRGVMETIEEVRYALDDEPPTMPGRFAPKVTKTPEQIATALVFQFITVPTSFGTQNAGITLEMRPSVSPDGTLIDVDLVPQHRSYHGMGAGSAALKTRDDWRFSPPQFRTLKTTTLLTLRSGEWRLLNVSVLREPAPAMEFFLMRVTALPVFP